MNAIKRAGLVLGVVVLVFALAAMSCDGELGTGENGQVVTVRTLPAEIGAGAAGTVRDVGVGIVAARDAVAGDVGGQLFGGGQ